MCEEENTERLKGMKCPECGSTGPFRIGCFVYITIRDNGDEIDPSTADWNDDDPCGCMKCVYSSDVRHFRKGAPSKEETSHPLHWIAKKAPDKKGWYFWKKRKNDSIFHWFAYFVDIEEDEDGRRFCYWLGGTDVAKPKGGHWSLIELDN